MACREEQPRVQKTVRHGERKKTEFLLIFSDGGIFPRLIGERLEVAELARRAGPVAGVTLGLEFYVLCMKKSFGKMDSTKTCRFVCSLFFDLPVV